jgi:Zn-dependent metalloprotease
MAMPSDTRTKINLKRNYNMKTIVLCTFITAILCLAPLLQGTCQIESGPFLIQIDNTKMRTAIPTELIKNQLQAEPTDSFALIQSDEASGLRTQTNDPFSMKKYQQYYKRIKVEHGIVSIHYKNAVPKSLSGEYYRIPNVASVPTLSEKNAREKALRYINAKTYKWQIPGEEKMLKITTLNPRATYYPKGELVFCQDHMGKSKNKIVLAYKFDIYAVEPLRRDLIYINAHSGEIVLINAMLKTDSHPSTGQGDTRYCGKRSISTTHSNDQYYLKDYTRGAGIETFNLKRNTAISSAVDFVDNDDQWTNAEYHNNDKDDAALDAHFGALKTYDYFLEKHNRSSMDGAGKKIQTYVHYGSNVFNAYWDGSVVLFGDGDGQADPLTTLDIAAHEIGHGLCQYTANLVYAYEPGALNEGLSDIWGACVEYYAAPDKQTWIIGEDMKMPIRSMSNPNDYQNPDTYKGTHWVTDDWDNGGVHYNSGVLNHWFYVLTIGKSGVNDHGVSYNVEGIGIDKAAKIIFRTEINYLTANSQYQDARRFSIQAAIDIYGENSNEVIQTENAWKAVGIYHKLFTPTALSASPIGTNNIKLAWNDNSSDELGFKIERGTISSPFTEIATTTKDLTTYIDNALANNEIYFYRIRAYNDKGISDYSTTAHATLGNIANVIIMKDTMVKTCSAIFLDPGAIGNYPDNKNYITTFTPAIQGHSVAITFSEFQLDYSDQLYIHDGASINAPLIGVYSGGYIPPKIIASASNTTGKLTVQFITNKDNNAPGFKATISCLNPNSPPNAPTNLLASAFTTRIDLSWSDNSYNEKGFVIERSYHSNAGFTKLTQVAANKTTYTDLQTLPQLTYYYRVKAVIDNVSSSYSNTACVKTGDAPIVMNNMTMTTCNAVFLDPGGFGNIPDNASFVTTFYPNGINKRLQVAFPEYSINYGVDILTVYDGSSTSAPMLFDGAVSTFIDTLTATNPSGTLTFKFTSEPSHYKASGWVAILNCINFPPKAPSALMLSIEENTVKLKWKDNSSNEDAFIIERSFNDPNQFYELARVPRNITEYIDPYGYSPGNKVLYRIRAANNTGGKSAPSNTALFVAPVVMYSTTWHYGCDYPLIDPGATGNYADNSSTQMTLYSSTWRAKVSLGFTFFDTEKDHDFLAIYDGENTSAPLIGKFSGNNLPPKIRATSASGALTLVFTTDGAVNKSGWEAQVLCGVSGESKANANVLTIDTPYDPVTIGNNIVVFPNPASSSFRIKLPASMCCDYITVTDLQGNRQQIPADQITEGEVEVNATMLPRGLITIQLQCNGKVITKRIFLN